MRFYDITLPLPTSVNAMHTVGGGYRNPKNNKWTRQVVRSASYGDWIDAAGRAWRDQYPWGVREQFTGRLRVYYCFIWRYVSLSEKFAADASDIGNREKVLSDFLEHKFFVNDNQIDEQLQFRRLTKDGENRVIVRVMEIPDRRFDDFRDIFNFKPKTEKSTMNPQNELDQAKTDQTIDQRLEKARIALGADDVSVVSESGSDTTYLFKSASQGEIIKGNLEDVENHIVANNLQDRPQDENESMRQARERQEQAGVAGQPVETKNVT